MSTDPTASLPLRQGSSSQACALLSPWMLALQSSAEGCKCGWLLHSPREVWVGPSCKSQGVLLLPPGKRLPAVPTGPQPVPGGLGMQPQVQPAPASHSITTLHGRLSSWGHCECLRVLLCAPDCQPWDQVLCWRGAQRSFVCLSREGLTDGHVVNPGLRLDGPEMGEPETRASPRPVKAVQGGEHWPGSLGPAHQPLLQPSLHSGSQLSCPGLVVRRPMCPVSSFSLPGGPAQVAAHELPREPTRHGEAVLSGWMVGVGGTKRR